MPSLTHEVSSAAVHNNNSRHGPTSMLNSHPTIQLTVSSRYPSFITRAGEESVAVSPSPNPCMMFFSLLPAPPVH
uniref:Uncharacterized protein n=1 Tax=Knipowitschia caucasica TaxID=637954 RepID=A0AAV2J784_KNICA